MKYIALFASTMLLSFAASAVEIGAKAPDFSLASLKNVAANGKVNLADYKGKVVYVDFWASWCGPCQRSFPSLDAIRNKYKDKGFEVIAINLDENVKDANDFLAKHSVSFPIAQDVKGKTADQFKLKGMPSAYIVDKQGVVKQIVVGFDEKKKLPQ